MNPSLFSARQELPCPGQPLRGCPDHGLGVEFVRGNEVLWLGMSRPQWFLLMILPLLSWRILRDSGNHSAQSWKEEWHERRQP